MNPLIREGETPAQALARIERERDYLKIIATDEGQALIEQLYVEGRSRERQQEDET